MVWDRVRFGVLVRVKVMVRDWHKVISRDRSLGSNLVKAGTATSLDIKLIHNITAFVVQQLVNYDVLYATPVPRFLQLY